MARGDQDEVKIVVVVSVAAGEMMAIGSRLRKYSEPWIV